MLVIRFKRIGRKNDPSFRLVVGEKTRHPTSGKHLVSVGSHNPKTKQTILDEKAIKHWLSKGAQVSGTVHNLLVSKGVIDGKKVNVRNTKVAPKATEEVPKAGVAPAPAVETPAE